MTFAKLPAWAAALMLSAATLGYGTYAQAAGMGGDRPDPSTAGQGQSNTMGGQPAGMPLGSGNRITGTSTGAGSGNRNTGMMTPAAMTPMGAHHMAWHHRHYRHRHHPMRHHTVAMGGGAMHDTGMPGGSRTGAMGDNPPPNAHSGQTNSDNGTMTGGNRTGRDDSNRGSAPNGGTNGVTPH